MTPETQRYVCTQCGYIYDPTAGDPLSGIPVGVVFDDLPATWVCPLCYANREAFDPLD